MRPILLVEDSTLFGKLVKKKIENTMDRPVVWAKSLAEAEEALQTVKDGFDMAVLDLNLPDAPKGEILPVVVDRGVSSFVFTADVTEELRDMVWSNHVADYIIKDDPSSLEYLLESMSQLAKNGSTLILIVDSSGGSRTELSELLYVRKFRVINASSGKAALDILEQHPETRMVLCDAELSDMDGFQLCRRIREKYKRENLAIIGLLSGKRRQASVRFLKSGASDVVNTAPLVVEEFYGKLQHCLEIVELLQAVPIAACIDGLTGLPDRKEFFDRGNQLYQNILESRQEFACLLVHLEGLQRVNEECGYQAGDTIIADAASLLKKELVEEIFVARFGGATFGLLFPADSIEMAQAYSGYIINLLTTARLDGAVEGAGGSITILGALGLCSQGKGFGFQEVLRGVEMELMEKRRNSTV